MKTQMLKIFTLFVTLLLSTHLYAKSLDAAGVITAYKDWCASIAIAKGNGKDVVKFYAPHAVLLPTLSDKILFNDNNGLDPYFDHLTSYKNIHCVTKRLITEIEGEDFATTAGFYQFIYDDKDGKTVTIPARFTFTYKKRDNKWEIIQHHSSFVPAGKQPEV